MGDHQDLTVQTHSFPTRLASYLRLSLAQSRSVPLRLAGGAGRSRFWAQTFADVTGRDVEVSPVEEIGAVGAALVGGTAVGAFKSLEAGVRSEEHTSELQSLMRLSFPVFCLKQKNTPLLLL